LFNIFIVRSFIPYKKRGGIRGRGSEIKFHDWDTVAMRKPFKAGEHLKCMMMREGGL
jgi:hypothetical protein